MHKPRSGSIEIINPQSPLGHPASPVADVRMVYYESSRGGSHRSYSRAILELTHVAQCRILRDFERQIGRKSNIALEDRMRSLEIGYDAGVGSRSRAAVEAITGNVEQFDAVTARMIERLKQPAMRDLLKSTNPIETHFRKRCEQTRILLRAKMIAGRVDKTRNSYRDTNVRSGKKPGLKRLEQVFLPHLHENNLKPLTIDEMLTTATIGLANPTFFYPDFSYLEEPLELAVSIGWSAIYRSNLPIGLEELNELRSIVIERRVPDFVAKSEPHRQQFIDVCAHVERAWTNLGMGALRP